MLLRWFPLLPSALPPRDLGPLKILGEALKQVSEAEESMNKRDQALDATRSLRETLKARSLPCWKRLTASRN